MADENALQDNNRPASYTGMLESRETGERRRARGNDRGEALTELAHGLSPLYDGVLTYPRGDNYTAKLSASTLVQEGPGKLGKVYIHAASSTPTIKIWDGVAASGGVILDTITPTAGQVIDLGKIRYATGLYIEISGTVQFQAYYDPTSA